MNHSFQSNAITVEFSLEKGVPALDADIYVNAASINPLSVTSWGGVAGGIQKKLSANPLSYTALQEDWQRRGNFIPVGQAAFVRDNQNQPVLLTWGKDIHGYLIHAGAPAAGNQEQRSEHLKSAYYQILLQAKELEHTIPSPLRIALPPLGIGIYGNSPESSAKAAFEAINKFQTDFPASKFLLNFAIFNPTLESDRVFHQKLLALFNQTTQTKKNDIIQDILLPKASTLDKPKSLSTIRNIGLTVFLGAVFPTLIMIMFMPAQASVLLLAKIAIAGHVLGYGITWCRQGIRHHYLNTKAAQPPVFVEGSWGSKAFEYGQHSQKSWLVYFTSCVDPRAYHLKAYYAGSQEQNVENRCLTSF